MTKACEEIHENKGECRMAKYRKLGWTEADMRCPFYLADDRAQRSLSCEGFCEGSETRTRFETLRARDRHMGKFCAADYESCAMYRTIYENKYADE